MSKRSLPATPFRVIGPEGSYETSSSSISPETGLARMEGETGTDAGPGLQVSAPAKGNTKVAVSRMRSQTSEPSQPSGAQGDPSTGPGVHVYDQRTLNHLQVLNQHNIDRS